jgi:hypothetical protein
MDFRPRGGGGSPVQDLNQRGNGSHESDEARGLPWQALTVFGVAAAIRALALFELARDPAWAVPVIDERTYLLDAAAILAGRHRELLPYWQAPGIVFVLAGLLAVAGSNLWVIRTVQVVMSALSCAITYRLALRIAPRPWAFAAGLAVSANGVHVLASAEILPAVWAEGLTVAALELVALNQRTPRPPALVAAGFCLGASSLFNPLIVAFYPFVLWHLALTNKRSVVGAFVVALIIPTAPVTVMNYRATGRVIPISANAGANFFLGNSLQYPATVAMRPGTQWDRMMRETPASLGVNGRAGHSDYFFRRATDQILESPARWISSVGRKLVLFFSGHEIPRNLDIYVEREQSRVLRLLVGPAELPYPGLILWPLCLCGVVATVRLRATLGLVPRLRDAQGTRLVLVTLLLSQAAAVALFFVTSRYRVPVIGVGTMLAILGIRAVWMGCRGSWARFGVVGSALVAVTLLLNLDFAETRVSLRAERYFQRARALAIGGSLQESTAWLLRARLLDPGNEQFARALDALQARKPQ